MGSRSKRYSSKRPGPPGPASIVPVAVVWPGFARQPGPLPSGVSGNPVWPEREQTQQSSLVAFLQCRVYCAKSLHFKGMRLGFYAPNSAFPDLTV